MRAREFPGAFSWTAPTASADKAEPIVTAANDDPSVRSDIIPSMVLLLAKARAGELGREARSAAYAFACWVTQFTTLQEEIHGRQVEAAEPFEERRNAGPVQPRLR